MALSNGFNSDVDFYEKKFNMKAERRDKTKGELVFFWNNGLVPFKSQSEILFTIIRGKAGFVTFANEQYGLSFDFPLPKDSATRAGFASLEFIRMAIPKYLERKPYYSRASIQANNNNYGLEPVEDINKIAFKSLDDRFLKEIGNAVLFQQTRNKVQVTFVMLHTIFALAATGRTKFKIFKISQVEYLGNYVFGVFFLENAMIISSC